MRKWTGYINKQYYSECQIVSVLNCVYFFTGKRIRQKSKEYEALVDEFNCRKEGASGIEKLYNRYGLTRRRYDKFPLHLAGKFPIETGVIHKEYHSCVIVDCKGYNMRVANIPRLSKDGWIPLKKLKNIRPRYVDNCYFVVRQKKGKK
jgi:hypothetical protein